MNANKSLLNNSFIHAILMNFLILLNYLIWYFGYGNIMGPIIIVFFMVILLYSTYSSILISRENFYIYTFIGMLFILALLTPSTDWDARSIWLFHAKRIFFENNLFAQFDNYAEWSHNDYPVMIPALTASFAHLVGTWNELFPKIAMVLSIIPSLLIIRIFLKKPLLIVAFLFFILFFGNRLLFNGYMDAILALHLVSSILTLFYALKINQKYKNLSSLFYLSAAFDLSVLVMTKNEGILMLLLLFISVVIFLRYVGYKQLFKILYVFALPLFFLLSWKIMCHTHGIENDLTSGDLQTIFFQRITSLDSILIIVDYMLLQQWVIFLFIISYLIYHFQKGININYLIVFYVLTYVLSIFTVYFLTPNELEWHLKTSSERVLLPINFLLFTFLLIQLKNLPSRIFNKGQNE